MAQRALVGPSRVAQEDCGVVFELTPQPWRRGAETIIYDFSFSANGESPEGSLAIDKVGNVYGGTSYYGGPTDRGTIFELTPGVGGWTFSMLYGVGVGGVGLILDSSNNLYGYIGAGQYGSGAINELSSGPDDWFLRTLYSFCGPHLCPDGDGPKEPLSWDSKGNLFGTTYFGGNGPPKCPGSLGCGVAFELSRRVDPAFSFPVWTYHVLHRFANFPTDGGYPGSGLVVDAAGNVYGASYNGGKYGNGVIYELSPSPTAPWVWTETQLYNFPSDIQNGGFPVGTMVFDKAGSLYGSAGGGTGCGGFGLRPFQMPWSP
jgi:uncharacterized repeat protein (TIGR03803 family)